MKDIVYQPRLRGRAAEGFTLVEMAVALSIAAVILAAIWTGFSMAQSSYFVSRANQELVVIARNMRPFYDLKKQVDPAADMTFPGPSGGNGLTYIRGGVFPRDTLNNGDPSASTQALDPWGGTIAIDSTGTNGFKVQFSNVPQSACIKMLVNNTGPAGDPGLQGVFGGASAQLPLKVLGGVQVTPQMASRLCDVGNNWVGFSFLF